MNEAVNQKFQKARELVMKTRLSLDHLSDAFSFTGNHDVATKLALMSESLHQAIELSDKAVSEALALYVGAVDKASATMLATALAMASRSEDAEGE